MKKLPDIFYTCAPNIAPIWCTVPEIWSEMEKFFFHYAIFCPSLLPLLFTRKTKILKRWKGDPGDVIILHIFIWNENYMMYGSWDMEREARIFCHFRPVFTLLLPPNPKQPVIKTINWWIKKSNRLVILFLMEKV